MKDYLEYFVNKKKEIQKKNKERFVYGVSHAITVFRIKADTCEKYKCKMVLSSKKPNEVKYLKESEKLIEDFCKKFDNSPWKPKLDLEIDIWDKQYAKIQADRKKDLDFYLGRTMVRPEKGMSLDEFYNKYYKEQYAKNIN